MRITRRAAMGGLLAVAAGQAVRGAERSIELAESPKAGELFQVELQLALVGRMKVDQDDKPEQLPIEAKAKHHYRERVDPVAKPAVARHYFEAVTESAVAGARSIKKLADDRRGVFVYRNPDGAQPVSPAGPLSRGELEIVAEHFDSLAIPNLLPGKSLSVGDSWTVPNDAVQAVCHFDGLIKAALVGKLVAITESRATFAIDGTAEGVEHGAKVRIAVAARDLRYGEAARRTARLDADGRSRGRPRQPRDGGEGVDRSDALRAGDARQRTGSPAREAAGGAEGARPVDATPPRRRERLRVRLRSRLAHRGAERQAPRIAVARPWRVRGAGHLRRVEARRGGRRKGRARRIRRGDPQVARLDAGESSREWPHVRRGGAKRLPTVRRGKQDGVDVVQAFHLLEGNGRHLAIATVCNVGAAEKLGTRDAALVAAVEFTAKK